MIVEKTAWTARLAHVPSWALSEELQRRGEEASTDPTIRLPGLVVDPLGNTVLWRGEDHRVGGRMMEVLYALALTRLNGRRRVRSDALALMVWRGWNRTDAMNSLRCHVRYLRQRLPGLIVSPRVSGAYVAYELVLDDEPVVLADQRGAAS